MGTKYMSDAEWRAFVHLRHTDRVVDELEAVIADSRRRRVVAASGGRDVELEIGQQTPAGAGPGRSALVTIRAPLCAEQ